MKKIISVTLVLFIAVCSIGSFMYRSSDLYEYSPIIKEYKKIISALSSNSFEDDYNSFKFVSPKIDLKYEWSCMILEMYSSYINEEDCSFGYVLYDFDKNGTKELFLVRNDGFILSVFTKNDSLIMLDAFWSKHKCEILISGELCVYDSITAEDFSYNIKKYDEKERSLITSKSFGCTKGQYYEHIAGENVGINLEEFEKLKTTCSDYITLKGIRA